LTGAAHCAAQLVMADKIFVTCASYVLGRILGQQEAAGEMQAQLHYLASGARAERPGILPAMRTVTALSRVAEVVARCDGGCSDVAKYRSRMLHEFLASDCTAWMSIDDDVEANDATLRDLLIASRALTPTVAVAPCLLRDGRTVNVRWPAVYVEAMLSSGTLVRKCEAAGFGLVMMNRAAAESVARIAYRFVDDDGKEKAATFFPIVLESDGSDRWLGEDLSFFERARTVEKWALLSGATRHAGHTLEFARLL
jgi:hypothetical protein